MPAAPCTLNRSAARVHHGQPQVLLEQSQLPLAADELAGCRTADQFLQRQTGARRTPQA